jgi:hypothetical protein
MINITPEDMLAVGLNIIGFDPERERHVRDEVNHDRFRKAFGASPTVCSLIFHNIQQERLVETTINKPKVKYFLMSFYWLKMTRFALVVYIFDKICIGSIYMF